MSHIKGKDSKIERSLREALSKAGLRYRKNVNRLPGKPDVAFIDKKVVVFLDSCFWHGCRRHGGMPTSNKKFWREKIRKNKERDRIVKREYKRKGWIALRVWEHDLKKNTSDVVSRITTLVS